MLTAKEARKQIKPRDLSLKKEIENLGYLIPYDAKQGRACTGYICDNKKNKKALKQHLESLGYVVKIPFFFSIYDLVIYW